MTSLRSRSRAPLAALSLVLVAVCAGASTAGAPVPVADGVAACTWLKLKAKASSFEVEEDDAGLGPKRAPSATCYLQLMFAAPDKANPHGRYGGPLLCQVDFETWEMSGMGEGYEGKALGDGNVLGIGTFMTFKNDAGDVIMGFTSTRMAIAVNKKTGEFKKATLTSSSGELFLDGFEGSVFNETPAPIFGGFSVKGSTVQEGKVPADALALLADSPCSMAP